jgi:ribose transport system substrate-binding protein
VNKTRTAQGLVALAAIALIVGACSTAATPAPATPAPATAAPATAAPASEAPMSEAPSAEAKTWKIGYSNAGGVGNGFREEQVCTAKAEASASGQVSEFKYIHENRDTPDLQAADIRTLIAAAPDAIVFNPNDPSALNSALDEAQAAGIKTIAVDAFVTDPETYNLYNNQKQYAYLGAKWLFEKLGGKGKVYYMRGYAGHPADDDRHEGFKEALAEFPGIEVLPSIDGEHTQWDSAKTVELMNNFISSGQYDTIQGIWTSGMDIEAVDAIKANGKKFVPIVGADRGGFVKALLDETGYAGLEGAAVTNTAAVGGAGVALAVKLLNGEAVETDSSAPQPNTVLLKPVLAADDNDAGRATLDSWLVEGLDPTWPLGLQIEGFTHYTPEEAIACKDPQ